MFEIPMCLVTAMLNCHSSSLNLESCVLPGWSPWQIILKTEASCVKFCCFEIFIRIPLFWNNKTLSVALIWTDLCLKVESHRNILSSVAFSNHGTQLRRELWNPLLLPRMVAFEFSQNDKKKENSSTKSRVRDEIYNFHSNSWCSDF